MAAPIFRLARPVPDPHPPVCGPLPHPSSPENSAPRRVGREDTAPAKKRNLWLPPARGRLAESCRDPPPPRCRFSRSAATRRPKIPIELAPGGAERRKPAPLAKVGSAERVNLGQRRSLDAGGSRTRSSAENPGPWRPARFEGWTGGSPPGTRSPPLVPRPSCEFGLRVLVGASDGRKRANQVCSKAGSQNRPRILDGVVPRRRRRTNRAGGGGPALVTVPAGVYEDSLRARTGACPCESSNSKARRMNTVFNQKPHQSPWSSLGCGAPGPPAFHSSTIAGGRSGFCDSK